MIPNIFGRVLCLGILVGVLKHYAIIALVVFYFCLQMVSFLESLIFNTKKSRSFLGILTSFTSPCLIVKEDSKHFLVNGLIGCGLYVASIWILYFNASGIRNFLPNTFHQHHLIIECHYNFSTSLILRCPVNATNSKYCKSGMFAFTNQTLLTICPSNYGQWYFLWLACLIVTGILISSVLIIILLHCLIDQERKMFLAEKIGINTCQENDLKIKPCILKIMKGKSYEDVNAEAIEVAGKPLLELFVQSRRYHMVKVFKFCQ